MNKKEIDEKIREERVILHRYSSSYAVCGDIETSDMFLGCIMSIKESIRNLLMSKLALQNRVVAI